MTKEKYFDLSEFLGDSLSLQYNMSPHTRHIYTPEPNDYYEKFVLADPYEILGETNFGKPKENCETIVGTPIQEFFRGSNVFITGATGFFGKILIEKLIRCVPNIGHIYLLIRSKRGTNSKERFEQLLENQVFSRMKTEVPDYAAKLTVVDGDIGEPDLGLNSQDRRTLTDRIHVVFHSAANVRFIEPLKVAIASNVLGSQRVIQLAKEMKNLKSYVHVSTAFSQCVKNVVEENVLRMNVNYRDILNYIESKPDNEIEAETPRLLQGWPNTYTFSKALSEQMVQEEAKDLPVCIFRPSVVLATYREPVRGWTDNLYGPIGFFMGAGHGILHCARLKGDFKLDTVPVDYVVNCLIAAAWRTGDNTCIKNYFLYVYNFTLTSVTQGVCWKGMVDFAWKHQNIWPFNRAVWYSSAIYTENYYINEFLFYLLHRIPGACFDKLAELTGGTPGLTKIYLRIQSLKDQMDYFAFHLWHFKSDNVMELWHLMNKEDKKIFYFDVRDIDPREHFLVSKLGAKYYYLKEKMEDIPAAQRRNTWLYWIHTSVKITCSLVALKLLVLTAKVLPL